MSATNVKIMTAPRFARTSEEEREKKRLNLYKKKKRMTKICEEYLAVKGESDNFEEFDTMKLDETLG